MVLIDKIVISPVTTSKSNDIVTDSASSKAESVVSKRKTQKPKDEE